MESNLKAVLEELLVFFNGFNRAGLCGGSSRERASCKPMIISTKLTLDKLNTARPGHQTVERKYIQHKGKTRSENNEKDK
jgi:hypothetical protein